MVLSEQKPNMITASRPSAPDPAKLLYQLPHIPPSKLINDAPSPSTPLHNGLTAHSTTDKLLSPTITELAIALVRKYRHIVVYETGQIPQQSLADVDDWAMEDFVSVFDEYRAMCFMMTRMERKRHRVWKERMTECELMKSVVRNDVRGKTGMGCEEGLRKKLEGEGWMRTEAVSVVDD